MYRRVGLETGVRGPRKGRRADAPDVSMCHCSFTLGFRRTASMNTDRARATQPSCSNRGRSFGELPGFKYEPSIYAGSTSPNTSNAFRILRGIKDEKIFVSRGDRDKGGWVVQRRRRANHGGRWDRELLGGCEMTAGHFRSRWVSRENDRRFGPNQRPWIRNKRRWVGCARNILLRFGQRDEVPPTCSPPSFFSSFALGRREGNRPAFV